MSFFLSASLAFVATIAIFGDLAGFENKSDPNSYQSKTQQPVCEPCDQTQGKGCCANIKKTTT